MESKVCMAIVKRVRLNDAESDWFNINREVRQLCVMSPWLFNLYMDGVLKELEVWVCRGRC